MNQVQSQAAVDRGPEADRRNPSGLQGSATLPSIGDGRGGNPGGLRAPPAGAGGYPSGGQAAGQDGVCGGNPQGAYEGRAGAAGDPLGVLVFGGVRPRTDPMPGAGSEPTRTTARGESLPMAPGAAAFMGTFPQGSLSFQDPMGTLWHPSGSLTLW